MDYKFVIVVKGCERNEVPSIKKDVAVTGLLSHENGFQKLYYITEHRKLT